MELLAPDCPGLPDRDQQNLPMSVMDGLNDRFAADHELD